MGHMAKSLSFNDFYFKFHLFSSVLGLHCLTGFSLVAVLMRYSLDVQLLMAVASPVAEPWLWGTRAQALWLPGSRAQFQ